MTGGMILTVSSPVHTGITGGVLRPDGVHKAFLIFLIVVVSARCVVNSGCPEGY
jgi:hypothetical protein